MTFQENVLVLKQLWVLHLLDTDPILPRCAAPPPALRECQMGARLPQEGWVLHEASAAPAASLGEEFWLWGFLCLAPGSAKLIS